MKKKEMAEAMLAGKTLVSSDGCTAYFKEHSNNPFRFKPIDGDDQALGGAWGDKSWKIKEEPKMRYMTQDEILVFILYHPHILIRHDDENNWHLPHWFGDIHYPECHEYIEVAEDGTRSEPKRFMVEAQS